MFKTYGTGKRAREAVICDGCAVEVAAVAQSHKESKPLDALPAGWRAGGADGGAPHYCPLCLLCRCSDAG